MVFFAKPVKPFVRYDNASFFWFDGGIGEVLELISRLWIFQAGTKTYGSIC